MKNYKSSGIKCMLCKNKLITDKGFLKRNKQKPIHLCSVPASLSAAARPITLHSPDVVSYFSPFPPLVWHGRARLADLYA